MVQRERDPLTGAAREDVLMAAEDAARLGLADGARLRLRSSVGSFEGRLKVDSVKPGNLEVHWPEGNVLLSREEIDRLSHEPDYNACVTVEKRARPSGVAKRPSANSCGPPHWNWSPWARRRSMPA